MFSPVALSVLSAVFPIVLAQDSGSGSFVQNLVNYLNSIGRSQAADALSKVNSSGSGQQWLSQLQNGSYTVFVPSNEALQKLPGDVSGNTDLLSQYLSYHVVHGDFSNSTASGTNGGGGTTTTESSTETSTDTSSATQSAAVRAWYRRDGGDGGDGSGSNATPGIISGIYPNVTLGRTFLNSSDLVQLEANKAQVLAWTRSGSDGSVTILNQMANMLQSGQNITVTNSTTFQNIFLNSVDGVILPPGNLSSTLTAAGATSFLNLTQQTPIPDGNGGNTSVLNYLETTARGYTLFVPSNDAFQQAQQVLGDFQNNQTALLALLENHAINGTTLYSPDLQNMTASGSSVDLTTAAGEPLSASSNASGLFVQNQNGSSAQIVQPDGLVQNGVFHIINNVLVETDVNTQQASSAYESATSAAAAQSSTDTLPIGGGFATFTSPTTSETSTSTETSSSSTDSSTTSATQQLRYQAVGGSPRIAASPAGAILLSVTLWIIAL